MKKICIIGSSNLINMSLISIYTHVFDLNNIKYDLIYWDRIGMEETTTANKVFKYEGIIGNDVSRQAKLVAYIKYRNYVKKILKQEKYDVVILWQATTAYIIYDVLMRLYKKKYILNIRDYVAELKYPCNVMIKKLVKRALLCTISSKGFQRFLPKGEYDLIHSINEDLDYLNTTERKDSGKIVIGFAGSVRYLKENFRLIDNLSKDERFELWYCGSRSESVQEYVQQNNYKNVYTSGRFLREETTGIIAQFDLVNSAFGNDALDNSTLTPIRLFTALALHKPVIASKGSYLAELIEENKLGFAIDTSDEKLGDHLYEYYTNIKKEDFIKNADLFFNSALAENRCFENKLIGIIK